MQHWHNNKCLKKQTCTFTSVLLKHLISIWSPDKIILEGSYWSTNKNTQHLQKASRKSRREQLCTLKKIKFPKWMMKALSSCLCKTQELQGWYFEVNLKHLEWKLLKYWQEHVQRWNNDKYSKNQIVHLPLKDPSSVWSHDEIILKRSYWSTDKNVHDMDKNANLKKSKSVP